MSLFENVLSKVSDSDLILAISEIDELGETGILSDGVVRSINKDLCEIAHEKMVSVFLSTTQNLINKEAANRWVKLMKNEE